MAKTLCPSRRMRLPDWTGQYRANAVSEPLSCPSKLRQRHFWCDVIEHHLDRQAESQLFGRHVDQPAHQTHALIHLNHYRAVRHQVSELWQHRLPHRRPGEELALARRFRPFPIERATLRAHVARDVPPGATVSAALKAQLVLLAELVKVRRHAAPTWQWPFVRCVCHFLLPPLQGR